MKNITIPPLIVFFIVILCSLLILPNLTSYLRPNLILIYVLLFAFKLGFLNSILYWILGGIFLDSFIANNFPINSVIFIGLFSFSFVFSKIFDFETKMSKIVMAFIFIVLYYLAWFSIYKIETKNFNFNLILYCLETFVLFLFIFNINSKKSLNEKLLEKF